MTAVPRLRPMTLADAEAVMQLAQLAFGELDARAGRPPDAEPPTEPRLIRFRNPVRTDPGGCWVAEDDGGQLVGAAQAIARDGIWGLSLLIVHPDAQSRGLGRELLARALDHADGGRRGGIILASEDGRALRRYATAGFALDPALEAHGVVTRPPAASERVVPGSADDLDDVDAIGRAVRGAGHGSDVRAMLDAGSELSRIPGEGFVVHRGGHVYLLAARDDEAGAALLRSVLSAHADADVGWITSRQRWALPVVLDAGLHLRFGGAVCTRGDVGPFRPYLPSGAYL